MADGGLVLYSAKQAGSWVIKGVARLSGTNDEEVTAAWEQIRDELVDDLRKRIDALEADLKSYGARLDALDAAQAAGLLSDVLDHVMTASAAKRRAVLAVAARQHDPRIPLATRRYFMRTVEAMYDEEIELLFEFAKLAKSQPFVTQNRSLENDMCENANQRWPLLFDRFRMQGPSQSFGHVLARGGIELMKAIDPSALHDSQRSDSAPTTEAHS